MGFIWLRFLFILCWHNLLELIYLITYAFAKHNFNLWKILKKDKIKIDSIIKIVGWWNLNAAGALSINFWVALHKLIYDKCKVWTDYLLNLSFYIYLN